MSLYFLNNIVSFFINLFFNVLESRCSHPPRVERELTSGWRDTVSDGDAFWKHQHSESSNDFKNITFKTTVLCRCNPLAVCAREMALMLFKKQKSQSCLFFRIFLTTSWALKQQRLSPKCCQTIVSSNPSTSQVLSQVLSYADMNFCLSL